MFNKLVDAFARVRLGYVVAAAATLLAVPAILAGFTATAIIDVPNELDFTDLATDLGTFLLGALLVVLIMWGLSVATHSIKHFASTHSFRHFAK